MLAGLSAVAGTAMVGGALPLAAQQGKPVVGLRYQNFKRGTIHSLDPATRGLVIVWEDLGRIKLKAADLVTNYAQLKVGQVVDVHWYSYVDFMVALTTPQITAQAQSMVAHGASAEGIPGSEQQIRMFIQAGMVVTTDTTANTINIVNPASSEVLRTPRIVTANGAAALKTLKPGDPVTTVFTQETALSITIIR